MPDPRKRVLIVDDDVRVADALKEYLELEYDAAIAPNALAALAACELQRPDVALVDVTMPGMTGLELLRRLRAADPSLPVIMLTGLDDDAVVTEAFRAGAFSYIAKPFKGDHLMAVVAAALDRAPQT